MHISGKVTILVSIVLYHIRREAYLSLTYLKLKTLPRKNAHLAQVAHVAI